MPLFTRHAQLFFDPPPAGAAEEDAFLDAVAAALVRNGAQDVRRGPREVVFRGAEWQNVYWSCVGYVDSGRVWIADLHGTPVLRTERHFHRLARWLMGLATVLTLIAAQAGSPGIFAVLAVLCGLVAVPAVAPSFSDWRKEIQAAAASASLRLTA